MPNTVKLIAGALLLSLSMNAGGRTYAQLPAADSAPDVGPPVLETNPAVRAALEVPREEPADYFQAITWLIDLDRPELAKPILEELTKLQLTEEQRAELVAQFGSRSMLRLARSKALAPEGAAFADAAMNAAAAAATDPQRIAALVEQLTDASAESRQLARADLRAAGQAGAVATLEALAKETDPDRRATLLTAIASMKPFAVRPLLAMLETSDPTLHADVANLLRHFRVPQAMPFLPRDATSAEQAFGTALEHFQRGTPPFAPNESNQVEIWSWSDLEKRLTPHQMSVSEAAIHWMARLAIALAQIRSENSTYNQQAIVLGLQADDTLNPAGMPLSAATPFPYLEKIPVPTDSSTLDAALSEALSRGYSRAAGALILQLQMQNDPNILYPADAQPSPLADALSDPDRRVRFAALRAIMALDPPSPYPGSSRVPDTLVWFASSAGKRTALIAMPTLLAASDVAGMLAAYELDAAATNRGREAIELARSMADLEMIFVDMNIIRPAVREVVYELRIRPETATVPIALLAADGRLADAQKLAAEHDRVIAVSRPHSQPILARIVEEINDLAGRNPVSAEERAAQAADARKWLEHLVATRPFYTIRRTELQTARGAMPTARRGHAERVSSMATPSRGHGTPVTRSSLPAPRPVP